MSKLTELLALYEKNINPEQIERNLELQKRSLDFEEVDRIPLGIYFPKDGYEPFKMTEAHEDVSKMMFNELLGCFTGVMGNSAFIPMLRANYGVGTLPSLFGLKCKIINNSMPWVDHIGGIDDVRALIKAGVPDLNTGFGKKLTETHRFYSETLSQYPKCKKYIPVFHPDFQGPFDVAHLIFGHDIYTALYDMPELVHELMDLVTKTYIALMKRTKTEINDEWGDYFYQFNTIYKGKLHLRNDSTVNVSADTFKEFIKPYDERIYAEFGGGSMHYCGRADHLVFDMIEEQGLLTMNFGIVPSLVMGIDHLEFLHDRFEAKKMPIMSYGLSKEDFKALDKKRFKTGLSVNISADSSEEAAGFYNEYR